MRSNASAQATERDACRFAESIPVEVAMIERLGVDNASPAELAPSSQPNRAKYGHPSGSRCTRPSLFSIASVCKSQAPAGEYDRIDAPYLIEIACNRLDWPGTKGCNGLWILAGYDGQLLAGSGRFQTSVYGRK